MADEYISREAAKEKLCSMCRWEGTSNCEECEHPIYDIPAADVAPVRHGRDISDEVRGHMEFKCSLCGCELSSVYGGKNDYGMDGGYFNFCPNCGCRMDLEDET